MFDRLFSADMRRFSLWQLLLAVTSFALASGLVAWFGESAYVFTGGIILFWTGNLAFRISDAIDLKPLEERSPISKTVNMLGLIFVIASLAMISLGTVTLLVVIWSQF